MIRCLLVNIARDSRGETTVQESCIEGESIELGRGDACPIRLPDPGARLLHATLRRSGDGLPWLAAEPNAAMMVDGLFAVEVSLRRGVQVVLGSCVLTVEAAPAGFDLKLRMERRPPDESGETRSGPRAVTLDDIGLSKRRLGLWMAAGILFCGLLLLLAARLPAVERWLTDLPLHPVRWLSPGPLTRGHAVLADRCLLCHTRAFREVANATCTECHARMGAHLTVDRDKDNLTQAVRCAQCHPAHAAKAASIRVGLPQCVVCHRTTGKEIGEVTDFSSAHPEFRLTLVSNGRPLRSQYENDPAFRDQPGLKFSHREHLVKEGVSTPDGNTVLVCQDCHRLEAAGEHFEPMDMTKSCQQSRCHRIRVGGKPGGLVAHAPVADVFNRLRLRQADWLANLPAGEAQVCSTEGGSGSPFRRSLDCADRLARQAAEASLFGPDGDKNRCSLCHEVAIDPDKNPPWQIAPVRINRDWYPRARFSHARHDTVQCAQCHRKSRSEQGEDVSIPVLAQCRECHAGIPAGEGKVGSTCANCHRYHRIAGSP